MTIQRSIVSSKLVSVPSFRCANLLVLQLCAKQVISNRPTESEGSNVSGTFGFGSAYLHIATPSVLPFQEFIFKKVTRLLWEGREQSLFIYLLFQYLLTLYCVPDTILGTGDALMKRTLWSCGDKV